MSLDYHWTCDLCGRHETRQRYGPPPGWSAVRNRAGWRAIGDRGISHRCSVCAPPGAEPSLARRLFRWCQWNPALAAIVSSIITLLAFVIFGSIWVGVRMTRVAERIALERAQVNRPVPQSSPTPLRP
jgi:hypothetical protein